MVHKKIFLDSFLCKGFVEIVKRYASHDDILWFEIDSLLCFILKVCLGIYVHSRFFLSILYFQDDILYMILMGVQVKRHNFDSLLFLSVELINTI